MWTQGCKITKYGISVQIQVYRVAILQCWCAARTTHCDSGYASIATYSLPDLLLPKIKLPYLLLQSLTDFLVLIVLCIGHIRSHPLNETTSSTSVEGCWLSIGRYVSRYVDRYSSDMLGDIAANTWPICWPLIIGGISVACWWSIGWLSFGFVQLTMPDLYKASEKRGGRSGISALLIRSH